MSAPNDQAALTKGSAVGLRQYRVLPRRVPATASTCRGSRRMRVARTSIIITWGHESPYEDTVGVAPNQVTT